MQVDFQKMKLRTHAHIHMMGICGTAMASFAGILQELGYKVTGSDQNVYPPMSTMLRDLGIVIQSGYSADHLNPRPDAVIVGNVISKSNPEAQALLELGIPYTSLPQAMGDLVIGERESIVIAGTHGKTTTTALVSWIAESVGLKAGFMIGGVPLNFPHSFRRPQGNWFVIEGDEYDTAFFDKGPKFLHYRPKYVILTSIEFDHADIYRDLDHVKQSFQKLLETLPSDGLLIYGAGDKNISDLLKYSSAKAISYGLHEGDYRVMGREVMQGRNQVSVRGPNGQADLALKIFGPHNTLNALGAFALCDQLGWPVHKVLQGLADFKGVKRRQEVIGEGAGVTVVEDFAHHPTAVKLTIEAMRERFPHRRVLAVFEPRSATSRRRVFQSDYTKAFMLADRVYVSEPFHGAAIDEADRFSSKEMVADLQAQNVVAAHAPDAASLSARILTDTEEGDVILIMSNGAFGGIYQMILEGLTVRGAK